MNKRAKRLLGGKIAFVGSVAGSEPHIKAMLVARREGDNVFYFDSNNGSQRVAHWLVNPNACVYFFVKPNYCGVMLTGEMEIINDPEMKRLHWKPGMKMIYKDGVTDPDYCILRFTARSGRYYCNLHSEDFILRVRS